MLKRGIEWEQRGTYNEHLSVLDFKKQERAKEVEHLENDIKSREYILEQRKYLIAEAEKVIDKIDAEYQEKNTKVEQLDSAISEKQNALAKTDAALDEKKAILYENAHKVSKIIYIDNIETGKTMFGGKVTVAPEDYDRLTDLAKKQIAAESKEGELTAEVTKLKKENEALSTENSNLREQAQAARSLKFSLSNLQRELDTWKQKYNRVIEFIESLNLKERLDKFLHPVTHIKRGR